MSNLYKYTNLITQQTPYAKRMQYLANRIFGEVARPTNSKSMKVVRMLEEEPLHKRDYVVNWYPRHVQTHLLTWNLRNYGLFRDEHADWKDEMKRLRYLRGKRPPPKGQGKRSSKK